MSPFDSLASDPAASKKENVQVYVRVRPPFQHENESSIEVTLPCWVTLSNYDGDMNKDFQFN